MGSERSRSAARSVTGSDRRRIRGRRSADGRAPGSAAPADPRGVEGGGRRVAVGRPGRRRGGAPARPADARPDDTSAGAPAGTGPSCPSPGVVRRRGGELGAEDGGLQRVQPAVAATARRGRASPRLPARGWRSDRIRSTSAGVVGDDGTAVPERAQVLAWIEAEGGRDAEAAHPPPREPGTVRLCGVLDQGQAVPPRARPAIASTSAVCPYRCTAMTAAVLGPTAAATASGSTSSVSGRTSTNRGRGARPRTRPRPSRRTCWPGRSPRRRGRCPVRRRSVPAHRSRCRPRPTRAPAEVRELRLEGRSTSGPRDVAPVGRARSSRPAPVPRASRSVMPDDVQERESRGLRHDATSGERERPQAPASGLRPSGSPVPRSSSVAARHPHDVEPPLARVSRAAAGPHALDEVLVLDQQRLVERDVGGDDVAGAVGHRQRVGGRRIVDRGNSTPMS